MPSNATDAAECSTVETPAAPAGLLATVKSEPSSPERQRRRVLWRCIVCTDREAVFGRQGGAGFFPEWCQRCWRRKLRDLEGAKCDEDKNGPRLVAVTAEEHLSDAAIKVDHQLDPPGPEHQLRDPTQQSEYRGVSWSVRGGDGGHKALCPPSRRAYMGQVLGHTCAMWCNLKWAYLYYGPRRAYMGRAFTLY